MGMYNMKRGGQDENRSKKKKCTNVTMASCLSYIPPVTVHLTPRAHRHHHQHQHEQISRQA